MKYSLFFLYSTSNEYITSQTFSFVFCFLEHSYIRLNESPLTFWKQIIFMEFSSPLEFKNGTDTSLYVRPNKIFWNRNKPLATFSQWNVGFCNLLWLSVPLAEKATIGKTIPQIMPILFILSHLPNFCRGVIK